MNSGKEAVQKMKISGFTFVKNATKLYFPIKESIMSILPICDEFVVALGDCDDDDSTRELIESIGSPKIKIIDSPWLVEQYQQNTEYARQTDIAKEACSGDWLFYIQSDEVVHEKYLEIINNACSYYLNEKQVDAFLFHYRHFWGDFDHFQLCHQWYPREIRIIRNDPKIHSWRDAQSFRKYQSFKKNDYLEYLKKDDTEKLKVIQLPAYIYHYGCVRPPALMVKKVKKMDESYHGKELAESRTSHLKELFDYGPLQLLPTFQETHPQVLNDWISKFNWQHQLQYSGAVKKDRLPHVHEKLKVRIHTWIEQNLLGGRTIGGFKNFKIIGKYS